MHFKLHRKNTLHSACQGVSLCPTRLYFKMLHVIGWKYDDDACEFIFLLLLERNIVINVNFMIFNKKEKKFKSVKKNLY